MSLFSDLNPDFPRAATLDLNGSGCFRVPLRCPASADFLPSVSVDAPHVQAVLEPSSDNPRTGEVMVGAPSLWMLAITANGSGPARVTITLSRPWLLPDPERSDRVLDLHIL